MMNRRQITPYPLHKSDNPILSDNSELDIFKTKPFWVWGQQRHSELFRNTNGSCCFNHIIGLPEKNGKEYPAAQLIINISGTIAGSNQTHLIINTSNDWSPGNIVTIFVGIISAIGIGIALYLSHRGVSIQETTSKQERLIEIYKLTNNPDHREARANVYKAFKIYKKEHYVNGKKKSGKTYTAQYLEELKGKQFDNIFSDPKVLGKLSDEERTRIKKDVELVRASFDNIGARFNSKLIPEEALLKAMWGVTLHCWDSLEHHINIERDVRKTLHYMIYFEELLQKQMNIGRNRV